MEKSFNANGFFFMISTLCSKLLIGSKQISFNFVQLFKTLLTNLTQNTTDGKPKPMYLNQNPAGGGIISLKAKLASQIA